MNNRNILAAVKTAKISIDYRPHPQYSDVVRVVVTTKAGRSYYCDWTDRTPTQDEVAKVWAEERRDFQPYRA